MQGDESKEKEKGELRKQGLGRMGGHRVHMDVMGLAPDRRRISLG